MKVKSLLFFIVVALAIVIGTTTVQAVSTSITSSANGEVEVGTPVTVNVSFTAAAWNLTVSGDKITGASYASQTQDLSEVTSNKSFTVDTSTAGSYTIKLSGDVTGANGVTEDVEKSVTIKVKEKEQQKPNPDPDTTPVEPDKPVEPEKPVEKTPTFKDTNQTVYTDKTSGGKVNLRESWSTSSKATSVPSGTELTLTGTSTETINGYVWYRVKYNGQTKYVASTLITYTKPEEPKPVEQPKSSNTNLKELKVNVEGLTPAFDKNVKEYTLNVSADVEKIEVTATTEDEKSKYEVAGNNELKTGENHVLVTVNAEDGTKTIYEIKVTKAEPEGLKLTKLEVKDYDLSPKFNSDVYEYKLNVTTADKLEIVAEANEEKATIEIVGNTELQNGENLVTIMVKSEDGTKTVTYQITVNKKEAVITTAKTSTTNNLNKIIIVVAVLIAVAIIAIIIYLIVSKKKNKSLSSENYYTGTYDENDDDYDTIRNYEDEDYEEDDDDSKDGRGKHF